MRYGYARVSTKDQRLDLQIEALKSAGCDVIFSESASGTIADRPQLDALLGELREGDSVVVWKLDRLARSTRQLLELSERFDRDGVDLVSLNDQIDTSTPQGKLWFTMTAAMAEMERDMIVERTKAGLEAAKARGVKMGRPRECGEQVETAMQLHEQGMSISEACRRTGICRATYYSWLREMEDA